MAKPEFPKPKVGEELIIYKRATRYLSEIRKPVRVVKMTRFKITLEGIDGEELSWYEHEFDVRTQLLWGGSTRFDDRELHTPETLEYKLKQAAVDAFMSEHGIRTYRMRGALRKRVDEDPLGFVNLLKEWAGEAPI